MALTIWQYGITFRHEDATLHSVEVGQRLRSLRKARELTQVQLAKTIGLDQSTVSDIERGASFSAEVLMRLCEALGTTPRYVMTGDETGKDVEELTDLAHRLSDEDRQYALRILRALAVK